MNVLMLGDVVGEAGLLALEQGLAGLIKDYQAGFVVVNGENAAGGFGLTETELKRILAAGADVVTSGNHIWEKRDFMPVLDSEERVLRPANYPPPIGGPGSGGRGYGEFNAGKIWVVNLQGRDMMTPIDDPFRCFDKIYAEICSKTDIDKGVFGEGENSKRKSAPLIFVDFHAEATREKEALAYYLDGRATVLAGTHTHVQTADERILPGGTAYITDLGFTGAKDSLMGMDKSIALRRAREQVLYKMEAAQGGEGQIQGICVEIDDESGKAKKIERI